MKIRFNKDVIHSNGTIYHRNVLLNWMEYAAVGNLIPADGFTNLIQSKEIFRALDRNINNNYLTYFTVEK